jgi:hypothetical protein
LGKNVDVIAQKIDLSQLKIAKGAAFNSYENKHDGCLPGTRSDLLREIKEWAESPHGKCIFWLSGMAGTGKSTIVNWRLAKLAPLPRTPLRSRPFLVFLLLPDWQDKRSWSNTALNQSTCKAMLSKLTW